MAYEKTKLMNLEDGQELLRSIDAKKAPVITDSASGSIASFTDGADDLPVKELKVGIEPVQDLHGYDHPWPAGGGKNLFPVNFTSESQNSVVAEVLSNGKIRVHGTNSSSNTAFITISSTTVNSFIIPAGTYTISVDSLNDNIYLDVSGSEQNGVSYTQLTNSAKNKQITVIDGTKPFAYIRFCVAASATIDITIGVQIETGSSATTFAPYSNICPITGWTGANVTRIGKNLCDEMMNGYWAYANGDYVTSNEWICTKHKMPCKPDTDYVTSWSNGHYTRWQGFVWYDSNGNYIGTTNYQQTAINGKTAKSPKEAAYMTYNIASLYTGTPIIPADITDFQCEIGSSPTAYEAYRSNDTIECKFPQSAGTVYGGTLTVNEDGSGELIVDRGIEDIGNMSWVYKSGSGGYLQSYSLSIDADNDNIICSIYNQDKSHSVSEASDKSILVDITRSRIFVKDSDYSDGNDFKTSKTGQKIVYYLATPITYTITPQEVKTLLGTNHIWADTGDTEVTYCADTKLYIDRKITEAVANALNA